MKNTVTFLFLFSTQLLFSQSIDQIIALQQIDTMLYSGPKDNRINWVIQNRGEDNPNYDFTGQDDFNTLFENSLLRTFMPGDPLEQEPYAQYRDFFNLYAFWWPDAPSESEGWSFSTIQAIRDTVFLPWANEETGWVSFFSATKYGGGGGAGLIREKRVGDAKVYGMGWETLLHEFGHTMPGLLDEYSASGVWSGGTCWETPNTSGFTKLDDIPWRRWIEPGTPLPTPYTEAYLDKYGAFEGAMTNYFGCHRPTARGCFMGAGGFGEDYGQELCGPCVQRVICYLYQYVHVIENASPAAAVLTVTGPETLSFSADLVKPDPNTQQYEWILNGKVIATGVETVDITFGTCDTYELVLAVTDTNSLVRYDPKFEHIYPRPYQERRWKILQSDVGAYNLSSSEQIQPADCTGADNGSVAFTITGGLPPYEVFLDKTERSNPVTGLAAGNYTFEILDASGCGIQRAVTITQEALLNPRVCSQLDGNTWTLSIEDDNYPGSELEILWSTSAQTATVSNLPDGLYTVDITNGAGCSVQRSVTLEFADNSLQAAHTSFPTGLDENTGMIFLDISQGRPPYTVDWREKRNKDVTGPEEENILASGMNFGHSPAFAFDDDLGTKWLHNISSGAWIGYHVPGGAVVNYYAITSADDVPERDPKDWVFQASDDGTSWTTLDQQTDYSFSQRFQRRGFAFSNNTSYEYYRLYVDANHGNSATQLQELEFAGTKNTDIWTPNEAVSDLIRRTGLAAGSYEYTVKDANQTAITNTVTIGYAPSFEAPGLKVVQNGHCQVAVQAPNAAWSYYWLPDEAASSILSIGNTFQPAESGNYYVAAVDNASGAISRNRKGFAVTVAPMPLVEQTSETELGIIDPEPGLLYYWYDQPNCGSAVHTGTAFTPVANGAYYVAARNNADYPDPIDPNDIPGIVIRIDASDLNGDGITDDPAPATSSLLGWDFENGNSWDNGSWFAYRSNYQNGLGVADFATIWLQRITESETNYRTYITAYEENALSFPNTAPFEGLSVHFPRHADDSQLYSNSAPASTLNGSTYLNGQPVDPLNTANPMEFCILGTVMTSNASNEIFYTDTKWEGKLGELILWDKALTGPEMEGVSEYLRRKWLRTADLESPRAEVYWDGVTATRRPPANDILLFPNPTSGRLEISGLTGEYSIRIADLSGHVVKMMTSGAGTAKLDLTELPGGVYLVYIVKEDGSEVFVQKISKF